jgi:chorismate mutase
MDIADWRNKIDELDRRLVALLSERAHAARQIGLLKMDVMRNMQKEEIVAHQDDTSAASSSKLDAK